MGESLQITQKDREMQSLIVRQPRSYQSDKKVLRRWKIEIPASFLCLTSILLLVAVIGLPDIALAQGAKTSSPVEFARRADALKPGEWVWAADAVPAGPVLVYVDLSNQRATVYRNGVRIGVTTISSGKLDHE